MKVGLLLAAGAFCGLLSLSSCGRKADFLGSWNANAPEQVELTALPGAHVSATATIEFKEGRENASGDATLSEAYEITVPDSVAGSVSVTGTCRADGTWEMDVDDDDDLLVTYDYSTIKVELMGDSLTVAKLRPEVERQFRSDLSLYSVVEDIEVNKEKTTLSMKVGSPKKKVYFKRATL